MEMKEFIRKNQGKYFKITTECDKSYYYLKKVLSPHTTFDGYEGFLCISDYLYFSISNDVHYWKDEKIVISDRPIGNTERISKSEFYKMLDKYGVQRVQEKVSG